MMKLRLLRGDRNRKIRVLSIKMERDVQIVTIVDRLPKLSLSIYGRGKKESIVDFKFK